MKGKAGFLLVLILSGMFFTGQQFVLQVSAQEPDDLNGVMVAVYDGGSGISSEPRESSMAALYWMFRWMNATVEIVNSTGIKAGVLDEFQIIVVPGGYAYNYHLDLGHSGASAICDFVTSGGSYWGSCAGAFYACQEFEWSEYGSTSTYYYGLGLFPGRGVGPIAEIADWPDMAMTNVELNKTNELIELDTEPSNHSIMYYGGPYFETEGMDGITVLAIYSYNDKPAMIAFECMEGRVFLTGPHPEWEEDSFRDGCLWENYLEEEGSEWELCKQVSLWLVPSMDSAQGTSDLVLLATIGIIVLITAIIWSARKRIRSSA